MREKIGELVDLLSKESLETLGLGGTGFFNRAIWKREEYVKLKGKLKNALVALIAEEVKKLHCTYEICEDFRQKVLELLEGK